MLRPFLALFASLLLAACTAVPPAPKTEAMCPCPEVKPPAEKPLQAAAWTDMTGWPGEDLAASFEALKTSCISLARQDVWRPVCVEARGMAPTSPAELRAWFESRFKPWQLVNPDGTRSGLITGYYEPVLKGSRTRGKRYAYPAFAPPDDLIDVELGDLYPELKHMRLRGRIDGRRLVPYWSRAEWAEQEGERSAQALLWLDDALDFFFMQIQGSGQVVLDDGSRVRLSYADQNGYPYRSIGRWLADKGEMPIGQTSMQGIKNWAKSHPKRVQELMNANPSLVFFREMPVEGVGPPGAMGLALTPERSIAIDPRNVPLGAPVWLATTWPSEDRPLLRLMLAQDTGGAIRGVVRADFYWGSGPEAGANAGRMKQKGQMWVLMPQAYAPK
jgi:membrane-bound lytic murein transglycosylase A